MTITRTYADTTVHIVLTQKELAQANAEFVRNFMQNVAEQDFGYEPQIAKEIAIYAYDLYCEGNGETEYECVEKAVENYDPQR